jgi:alkane 1-monooxygenase
LVGITTAMGLACGALGINVAHELGHRTKKYEQVYVKIIIDEYLVYALFY